MKKELKIQSFIQSLCAGAALCIMSSAPITAAVFNLEVRDTAEAGYYGIGYNYGESMFLWGDRMEPYNRYVTRIAPKYLGNDFITVAGDSKFFTGDTLMTFDLDLAATVCLTPQYSLGSGTPPTLPSWITSAYTNTGDTLFWNDDVFGQGMCQIWKKDFPAGSHVVLRNQDNDNLANYGVVVKPQAIDSLVVYDTPRVAYFTLQEDVAVGKTYNPDNGYTISTIDASFVENQDAFITSATHSNLYTGDTLMTFKMGVTGYVCVAIRTTITPLPSWLDATWKLDTEVGDVVGSTGATYDVYKKWFAAGSKVALGNNGSTSYGNYFVIIHREASPLPGTYADTTISPTKDSFVRDGSYATANYGSEIYLYLKKAGTGYNRKVIVGIDVTGITQPVPSALLVLPKLTACASCTLDANITLSKTDATWSESTITWNNFPTTSTKVSDVDIEGKNVDTWWLDITSAVNDEIMNGDKVFSIIISSNTMNADIEWRSYDATAPDPYIEIRR